MFPGVAKFTFYIVAVHLRFPNRSCIPQVYVFHLEIGKARKKSDGYENCLPFHQITSTLTFLDCCVSNSI